MGLNFDEIDIDDIPDSTSIFYNVEKIEFSQHCDILLHDRSLDPNSLLDFYSCLLYTSDAADE